MVLRCVSPLLMEGDRVSLSTELVVKDGYLIDKSLGARHELSAAAQEAINKIACNVRYDRWVSSMTVDGLTDVQQTEIVQFLNQIGGLHVTRSWSDSFEALSTRLKLAILGSKSTAVTWRRPATSGTLALATIRAMTALSFLSIIVAVLCWGTGFSSLVDVTQILCGGIFIIWSSTFAHEYAHFAITSANGKQSTVIQQGMRLGILHPPLSFQYELASTFAGPLGGALMAASLAFIISQLGLSLVLFWSALVVAGFQTLSLLPWYGDGMSLWKLIGARFA